MTNIIGIFISPFILGLLILAVCFLLKNRSFKRETYYKITGNSYLNTISDLGKNGEYLTYKELKAYENDGGKFLFNCYLPKNDGTTTEIDVILIHSTGIFVIESKNYSGWIFGNEKSKTWTQTLRRGNGRIQKEHFYNPIMQNNTHVKWLKKKIGNNIPIYSVIAFSQRCSLKDITVESPDIKVINRPYIHAAVKQMGNNSIQALSKMDIERIHEMLYPYTQTTEYEKLKHIENINVSGHTPKKGTADFAKNNKAAKFETKENTSENIAIEQIIKTESDIQKQTAPEQKKSDQTPPKQSTPEEILPEQGASEQNTKRICARCGAELVLRVAKKGDHAGEQFYGCSRFPKCRYKENI